MTEVAPKAFAVSWALRDNSTLKKAGVDPQQLAKEVEKLMTRFPNANVNPDEQRQLRAALYQPLLGIGTEKRTEIVNLILGIIMQ